MAISAGGQPYYLTTDPGGTHLYVGLQNATTIAMFAIDSATGALCPLAGPVKIESNPLHIALAR